MKEENEAIPVPCNCEYRDRMFKDLEMVRNKYRKKFDINNHDFSYGMLQLATYYFKIAPFNEEQFIEFAKIAFDSLQLKE